MGRSLGVTGASCPHGPGAGGPAVRAACVVVSVGAAAMSEGRWPQGSRFVSCCPAGTRGPRPAPAPLPSAHRRPASGPLTAGREGAGWMRAAGRWWPPRPPAAPYAHAVAYSSHVPGLPSCHRHNYCSHGRGTCACRDPPVSLGLYCRCYSFPGRGLPSAGLSQTAAGPIHHGAGQLLWELLPGGGLCMLLDKWP